MVISAGLVGSSGVPLVEARGGGGGGGGGGGASSLFAEAEASMSSTIKSYRGVKEEWQGVRRLVDGAKAESSAGKATTMSILADTLAVGDKLAAISAEQTASAAVMTEQIGQQQATTALKYEAAETAAAPDSRKRPSYTASLFKAAQSEAAVLETVEGILRDYREVEVQGQEAAKRVAKIAQDIQASIDRLSEAEADLAAGSAQLERGVSPALVDRTSDNFRDLSASGSTLTAAVPESQGAKLFAQGVSGVDAAVGKSQATLRNLRDTCNALNAAGAEIDRLDARVAGVVGRAAEWEMNSKLSAGKTGQLLKQTAGQVNKLRDLGSKAASRACAASDKRDEAAAKAKKANKPSVVAGLRSVQGRLEVAERRTAETEALIRSASQKGAEEARRFRKWIPAQAEAATAK